MAVSKLTPMRYKNFVWPHNPRVYTITFERRMAQHGTAGRRSSLEALGMGRRVMRGEGEFVGPQAYKQFKALATVFYEDTPGALVHPVWQSANAYFVELTLEQEPRVDYVRYSFTFWECGGETQNFGLREVSITGGGQSTTEASGQTTGQGTVLHTVVKGDTLWAIARKYGVSLADLIAWNPEIRNPNLILPGQKVRVETA